MHLYLDWPGCHNNTGGGRRLWLVDFVISLFWLVETKPSDAARQEETRNVDVNTPVRHSTFTAILWCQILQKDEEKVTKLSMCAGNVQYLIYWPNIWVYLSGIIAYIIKLNVECRSDICYISRLVHSIISIIKVLTNFTANCKQESWFRNKNL